MDGPIEHSDSDSGESWTVLDHVPAYADEFPEFPENASLDVRDTRETIVEKDDDTDGISIISDSEPESPLPYEINYDRYQDGSHTDQDKPQFIPIKTSNIIDDKILHETISDDDFLGDSNSKHKTYVHRRNKRLSTVLNIIVLGSVITAAGVAIGHMWGAKNDCVVNNIPSVNKILSNLYKLQEENAYLRNKLKELTHVNLNTHQRKSGTESISKQNKCKKIFEDSINNLNSDKPIKCVDNDDSFIKDLHLVESEQDKQFLQDINKLKDIYKQNKSWLDQEIVKRMKDEQQSIKYLKNNLKSKFDKHKKNKLQEQTPIKVEFLETINEIPTADTNHHNCDSTIIPNTKGDLPRNAPARKISYADSLKSTIIPNTKGDLPRNEPARKISYADSLKLDQKINNIPKLDISIERAESKAKEHNKKKNNKDLDTTLRYSISEDEIKKDDRYVGPRHKQERKKHDRQKLHKKQKRKNKYEQWEMKGGFLKDYDDFSISSSQENEYVMKNPDKHFLAKDFERENYIKQFSEIENTKKTSELDDTNMNTELERNNMKNKEKEVTWFEKRTLLRNEARKKLEHELFGETSPNNAGWYFRRMQRREQCRAKGDNSTYRKSSKRNMNFKTKH